MSSLKTRRRAGSSDFEEKDVIPVIDHFYSKSWVLLEKGWTLKRRLVRKKETCGWHWSCAICDTVLSSRRHCGPNADCRPNIPAVVRKLAFTYCFIQRAAGRVDGDIILQEASKQFHFDTGDVGLELWQSVLDSYQNVSKFFSVPIRLCRCKTSLTNTSFSYTCFDSGGLQSQGFARLAG